MRGLAASPTVLAGSRPARMPPLAAPLMEQIAGDPILDEAYGWLCHQRQDASPHDDVWMLDHQILYQQLQRYVADERVLGVVWSYLQRTGVRWRRSTSRRRGDQPGLLALAAAGRLYLLPLDEQMERMDVFYARFMDDWVVLAPTRWKLRAAIRRANQVLCGLRLEKHPDKTFIGRIGRGFDFLGYRFGGRPAAGRPNQAAVCRACYTASRARCGHQPHCAVRSALVDVGQIRCSGTSGCFRR